MTRNEALALAATIRPHGLSEDVMKRFLEELEGRIHFEVLGKSEAYAPAPDAALLAPAPFDRLYWCYLVAMIDFSVGDKKAYEASSALFREAYDAYARWIQRTGQSLSRA